MMSPSRPQSISRRQSFRSIRVLRMVARPRRGSCRNAKPSRLSTSPVPCRSLRPRRPRNEVTSTARGESRMVASSTSRGFGRPAVFTAMWSRRAPPLPMTRSYRRASRFDIRARSARSALTRPLSWSIRDSFSVRGRSARFRAPVTRRSRSGSETGVRIVRAPSIGSFPTIRCNRLTSTTVRSSPPPSLSIARSRKMSRAGSGRSG